MSRPTSPFGSTTSGLKRLIRREGLANSETITGTVLSVQRLEDLDGNGSATWVCDVDVGADEPLRSAAVKAGSDGERLYAALGQVVKLARNLQGRFDVIGPGDRALKPAVRSVYQLGDDNPTSQDNRGLQSVRDEFDYYKGPSPGTPGTSFWNDGVQGFPSVRILDADGNEV